MTNICPDMSKFSQPYLHITNPFLHHLPEKAHDLQPVATQPSGNESTGMAALQTERKSGFLKEGSFQEQSCPEKFSHNHKHTQGQAEDSEPAPTQFPLRSCSRQRRSASCRPGSHDAAVLLSRHSKVLCVLLFPLGPGPEFRGLTLPNELWGTKVCCNVFTIPVGSLVLLSLNDRFP